MTKNHAQCHHTDCIVKFTNYKSQKKCGHCKHYFCDAHLRSKYWFGHIPTVAKNDIEISCLTCLSQYDELPATFIQSVKLQECSFRTCHEIKSPISKLKTCKGCGNFYCKKHTLPIEEAKKKQAIAPYNFPNAEEICTTCAPKILCPKPSALDFVKTFLSRKRQKKSS